jgi:6-phosphogluconolactonase
MGENREIVYIGSYSSEHGEGLYTFGLDRRSGELSQLFDPIRIENPSYLALDPSGRHLYCALETERLGGRAGGGVASFSVGSGGRLEFLNRQPSCGNDPCYVSLDGQGRFLTAANYGSGSFSIFPLAEDGSIRPCLRTVVHSGSGPVRGRQDVPHMHCTGFTPGGEYLYAVDLGIDRVKFYRVGEGCSTIAPEPSLTIRCRPGSGPRHLVFRGGTAYVVNELSSDISVFSLEQGRFRLKQDCPVLPYPGKGTNAPAALRLSGDGNWLFISNRGDDSIAAFRINGEGLLEPQWCVPSEGSGPRDFALDPEEKFLLAADETSGRVAVMAVEPGFRSLSFTGHSACLHRPSCVLFQVR